MNQNIDYLVFNTKSNKTEKIPQRSSEKESQYLKAGSAMIILLGICYLAGGFTKTTCVDQCAGQLSCTVFKTFENRFTCLNSCHSKCKSSNAHAFGLSGLTGAVGGFIGDAVDFSKKLSMEMVGKVAGTFGFREEKVADEIAKVYGSEEEEINDRKTTFFKLMDDSVKKSEKEEHKKVFRGIKENIIDIGNSEVQILNSIEKNLEVNKKTREGIATAKSNKQALAKAILEYSDMLEKAKTDKAAAIKAEMDKRKQEAINAANEQQKTQMMQAKAAHANYLKSNAAYGKFSQLEYGTDTFKKTYLQGFVKLGQSHPDYKYVAGLSCYTECLKFNIKLFARGYVARCEEICEPLIKK